MKARLVMPDSFLHIWEWLSLCDHEVTWTWGTIVSKTVVIWQRG